MVNENTLDKIDALLDKATRALSEEVKPHRIAIMLMATINPDDGRVDFHVGANRFMGNVDASTWELIIKDATATLTLVRDKLMPIPQEN